MKKIEEQIPIPEGLEQRLCTLIDRLDAIEQQKKRRRRQIERLSMAAGIALLLGFALWWMQPSAHQTLSSHDQQLAYAEACRALEMVSVNFNKGIAQLEKVNQELTQTNQKIETIMQKEQ